MNERLTGLWIGAQIRLRKFWEELRTEEAGVAEIVAIILVVAVVIAMVIIFRGKIESLITDTFTEADSFTDSLKTVE